MVLKIIYIDIDTLLPVEIYEEVESKKNLLDKNATNIEETCVADADILAHFDNIPMLFNSAFNRNNLSLNEVREWMLKQFEKDFNDLSDRTKENFKEKYNLIKEF